MSPKKARASLPETPEKSVILAATYGIVLFTIIVQGLSLRAVIERFVKPDDARS